MLSRNTLKYLMKFFGEVTALEPENKMTSYNCTVTVAPNIFRPVFRKEGDILSLGVHYEAMRLMIDEHDAIFNSGEIKNPEDNDRSIGI